MTTHLCILQIKEVPTAKDLEAAEKRKLETMKLAREVELLDLQKEYFKQMIEEAKPKTRQPTRGYVPRPRNNAQTPIRKFNPMGNL